MADTSYNPPSIDPSRRMSLAGTLKFILQKFLSRVDNMLPARVIAYDPVKNVASVQIMINLVTTLSQQVARAPIASVQVSMPSAGGFIVRLPIKAGDTGWLKANDRDISLFRQGLNQSPPNTARKHSFEDATFFPDAMFKGASLGGISSSDLYIGTIDGATGMVMDAAASSIALTSTTLTHNGKNIGSTHIHSGVQTGGSDTGAPV